MDDLDRKITQLTRKTDELLELTRQNNRLLRHERNLRLFKVFIIIIFLTAGSGYTYYLFRQYQFKIVQFQEKINELHEQLGKVVDLGSEIGGTAQSFRDIFSNSDE